MVVERLFKMIADIWVRILLLVAPNSIYMRSSLGTSEADNLISI